MLVKKERDYTGLELIKPLGLLKLSCANDNKLGFSWIAEMTLKLCMPNEVSGLMADDHICRSHLRLQSEESRIWSMWESYKYEYARK